MSELTQKRTGKELFELHYDALADRLAGAAEWQRELREAAIARFGELDLPTQRLEEWRRTPIDALKKLSFAGGAPAPVEAAILRGIERFGIPELGGARLVFVNGHYSARHSTLTGLPEGTIIRSLAEALAEGGETIEPYLGRIAAWEDQAFAALNTALFEDGLFLSLPANASVKQAIHILHLNSAEHEAAAFHPRHLILVGAGTKAMLIESYAGLDESVYFTNSVTEVEMGENSDFDHYKVQQESRRAFHFQTMEIRQRSGSKFDTHCLTSGGLLGRNDINATIDGENCDTIFNGLYMLTGEQMLDTHTLLDHAKPHCHSREIYKGILAGKSRAIFRGKILVRQHAQKTDAVQSSKNLLLSNDAQVDAQPQLEIYADDVKCTHGATIGQLNPEMFFYAQTRGLDRRQTQALLTFAFANDNLTEVRDEAMRTHLEGLVYRWLEAHATAEEIA